MKWIYKISVQYSMNCKWSIKRVLGHLWLSIVISLELFYIFPFHVHPLDWPTLEMYVHEDSYMTRNSLRDWSLITGRGATKREGGGACEVLPLRKGGCEKSFTHAEGGRAQKVSTL